PIYCLLTITAPHPSETYTLSLHDALPICSPSGDDHPAHDCDRGGMGDLLGHLGLGLLPLRPANCVLDRRLLVQLCGDEAGVVRGDRKSTRLNSSHQIISYAVFCLKKKNNI